MDSENPNQTPPPSDATQSSALAHSVAGDSSSPPATAKLISKPLSVWAKALIAVVSGTMIFGLIGIVTVCVFFKNTFERSQDPHFIAQLAQQVARFPQPLPRGYSYVFGADLSFLKIIFIDYENGKQQYAFHSYVNNRREPEVTVPMTVDGVPVPAAGGIGEEAKFESEAQKMVNRIYKENGVNTFMVQAKFESLIGRGSWLIQGLQIPYMVGKLAGKNGTGLVACIVDRRTNKDIIIYAVQPDGKDFDMKVCTNLLQDIKGF